VESGKAGLSLVLDQLSDTVPFFYFIFIAHSVIIIWLYPAFMVCLKLPSYDSFPFSLDHDRSTRSYEVWGTPARYLKLVSGRNEGERAPSLL
jgi:hypothetical protein